MRRTRTEMIATTRAKLMSAGREAFARDGFANAKMEEITGGAGLTRGALYHHFGGKEGLFAAVVEAMDAEITARLAEASEPSDAPFERLTRALVAYLETALEPELQRILFLDGPAVLGHPAGWVGAGTCIAMTVGLLEDCRSAGVLSDGVDPDATARLLTGATSDAGLWIAAADDPARALRQASGSLAALLSGLRRTEVQPNG